MKISFDKTNWYQLEWLNIGFREFEEVGRDCNSIEELVSKISESFPDAQLKYEYIGERKEKKSSSASKEPTKKRKNK